MIRFGAALAVAFLVSGCSASGRPAVLAEANGLVRPGMTIEDARTSLRSAGFGCEAGRQATVTCTRLRNHRVIASCVQRVNLMVDGARVRGVEVPNRLVRVSEDVRYPRSAARYGR